MLREYAEYLDIMLKIWVSLYASVVIISIAPINADAGLNLIDFNSKCPNYKSLAIVNSLVELKNENGKSFISLVVDVKEHIKGSVKSVMKIERCEDSNRCGTLLNRRNNKHCDELVSPTNPFSFIFKNMTPPYKCPFRKGSYKIYNKEMDLTYLKLMGLKAGVFKIKSQLHESPSNRLINCLSLDVGYEP